MKQLSVCIIVLLLSLTAGAEPPSVPVTVKSISISGNKKTRDYIILRELTFKSGDSIIPAQWPFHLEQSRRQLINLYLFNEVAFTLDSIGNVGIEITERWYIWPAPVLELADRNFNQWWLTKDFRRLIYGVELKWYNVRGRNESMYLTFNAGYTKRFDFSYRLPYIDRKRRIGLTLSGATSSNKEVWYKTDEDKLQFFKDHDRVLIKRLGFEANLQYRKQIFTYHNFVAGYAQTNVADTVVQSEVNNTFLYGSLQHQTEFYQAYIYTFDRRDIKGYPLKGRFIRLSAVNNIINPGTGNFQYLMLKANASQYITLGEKVFAGAGITARWCSTKELPYYNTRALGYNADYIRGYELYVIDGPSYMLGKSNIKYRLLNKKYYTRHMIPNYRHIPLAVYLTAFYDAGYVYNYQLRYNNNRMVNSLQYGYGSGLDFVFYYNNVLRFEYAFNKYSENRLYIHFIAPL